MLIRFKNWQKHQTRKVLNHTHWLKFRNDTLNDPKIYSLEDDEFRAFIYLLCEASKANKDGMVFVTQEHAHNTSRVQSQGLDRAIKKLKQLQIIETRTTRGSYTKKTGVALEEIRREEKREEYSSNGDCFFDFEKLYNDYPRKKGKSRGLKICSKEIKTADDYSALALAITNYKADLVKEKTKPNFVKHFSTFMGEWRDWIEPAIMQSSSPAFKTKEQVLRELDAKSPDADEA
jgi:hypothetical protein